jgi:hypothetical protein
MPATSKYRAAASELEQFAAIAIAANEIDAASKLAAEHRLSTEIIGVTIRASAGKIILGIVGDGIECSGLRAAEAALAALKDVAAVDAEAKRVLGKATAGGAWTGELALRRGL